MENQFGLSGNVLDRFTSYLKEHSECQFRVSLLFGVPQGTILSPALFTRYMKPLGTTAQRYGVKYHLCAHDTQLYNLEHCIADI